MDRISSFSVSEREERLHNSAQMDGLYILLGALDSSALKSLEEKMHGSRSSPDGKHVAIHLANQHPNLRVVDGLCVTKISFTTR
jgi:hypothetical protein